MRCGATLDAALWSHGHTCQTKPEDHHATDVESCFAGCHMPPYMHFPMDLANFRNQEFTLFLQIPCWVVV